MNVTVFRNNKDAKTYADAKKFLLDSMDNDLLFSVDSEEYKALLAAVCRICFRDDKFLFYEADDYKDVMNELIYAMIPYMVANDEPEGRLLNAIFKQG